MPRTCKNCKNKFEPQYNSTQMCCSYQCAAEYAKKKREKEEKNAWAKEKKKRKEALKTKQDYEKDLEKVFNKFIRLRDKSLPCISCGKKPPFTLSAGHFYPAGSYKNIRFSENNVHGQCWYDCNKKKHGNLLEYRKGLVKRFGEDYVNELDKMAQKPRKYEIFELKELIVKYKKKIKQLESI